MEHQTTILVNQVIIPIIGKTYKVVFEVLSISQGYFQARIGNESGVQANGIGVYTSYITATTNDRLRIYGTIISNRLNRQRFSKRSRTRLDFRNWLSVGDGKAISDGTSSNLIQSISGSANKNFSLTFTISNYISGSVIPAFVGNSSDSLVYSSNGTFTEVISSGSDIRFVFYGASFNASITNISVKEITDDTDLPRINYEGFSYQDSLGSELVVNGDFATDSDWVKGSNWTISGGSANADGSSGGQLSQTTSPVVVGKTYKIQYTILNYVSGSFRFSYAGTSESFNTSNGTYTTVQSSNKHC